MFPLYVIVEIASDGVVLIDTFALQYRVSSCSVSLTTISVEEGSKRALLFGVIVQCTEAPSGTVIALPTCVQPAAVNVTVESEGTGVMSKTPVGAEDNSTAMERGPVTTKAGGS